MIEHLEMVYLNKHTVEEMVGQLGKQRERQLDKQTKKNETYGLSDLNLNQIIGHTEK